MLENFKLIQAMEYSQFDVYLVTEYSTNEALSKILEPIRKKHINHLN